MRVYQLAEMYGITSKQMSHCLYLRFNKFYKTPSHKVNPWIVLLCKTEFHIFRRHCHDWKSVTTI